MSGCCDAVGPQRPWGPARSASRESILSAAAPSLPVVAEEGGGFHAPGIEEFYPPALFGDVSQWSFWGFDRIMLVRFVVVALLLLLLWLAVRRAALVPTRGQSIVEMMLDFVKSFIAEQVLGKERARPYIPMLTIIFFTVLAMNLAGVVPGLNIGGTARIGLPLLLAVWVFLTYLAVGVKTHGVGKYLKTQLFPAGVPWPAYILVTPIEIMQVFILRPATLAIRLLANMMAGHLMLVLCFAATHYMVVESFGLLTLASPFAFFGGMFITLFEIFISGLQAFIFTLLSAVYINFALEAEH